MTDETGKKTEGAGQAEGDPHSLLSEAEKEFYRRFDIPMPSNEEVIFWRRFGGPPIAFTRIERPIAPLSATDGAPEPQPEAPLTPPAKPETDR